MTEIDEKKSMIFHQRAGKDTGEFDWYHLHSDHESSFELMKSLSLPLVAIEGLMAQETRPKLLELEDGILIYLRAINLNHQADHDDMVSLRIWISEGRVVTTTKKGRALRSIEEVVAATKSRNKVKSIQDLLCILVEKITDKICSEVESYDVALDTYEALLNTKPERINRQEVIEIRRQSAQIKRYIGPQREALDAMQIVFDTLSKIQKFRLKEQTERIARYLETLDVMRERTLLIQDELRYQTAEAQNARMYVLSLVTAIFLPLSFLTGVFGMNVAGLPGLEVDYAFKMLMGAMTGLSVVILVLMKWSKWF
ncbi:zinc transporter ZntB [Thalassotalea sp. LPB0316]|uniref:zinc transporter ZntB n=1 Tax=Thalassotalea sp. LPB0316 TaxID=2769490 RepID=UPI0018670D43|nr:zinc transporter ZntB [Thalassotalea sp. LPB0316]QOL25638.1 zinc transporter ZntB [Thalassotalea sp. LPB0316]